MFTHEFNVYETLAKLDALLESGHNGPSPMDRAEYQILTNTLVQGSVELLRHLAMHEVLALKTPDSLETISARHVETVTTDSDGGFAEEVLSIDLPAHLVPYGAIVECMKSWNVATIETTADLAVLARLWTRYLRAEVDSDEESTILAEWSKQGERVSQRCLPALQQLDAAGLLRIRDLRTDTSYPLRVASLAGPEIELAISTEASGSVRSGRRKAPVKKSRTRKRSR